MLATPVPPSEPVEREYPLSDTDTSLYDYERAESRPESELYTEVRRPESRPESGLYSEVKRESTSKPRYVRSEVKHRTRSESKEQSSQEVRTQAEV